MPTLELVAHRGWPSRHVENTLSGIEAVLAAGARYVEVDVQFSADGVPVLFHDADLERLTGQPGSIAARPWATLAGLRLDDGARLATLETLVTSLLAWPTVTAFIEVKAEAVGNFGAGYVLDRLRVELAPLAGRAVLISFDLDFLLAARVDGWPRLGAVIERWAQRGDARLPLIAPQFLFTDVEHLPADGLLWFEGARIAVYEVAHAATARALTARGVDLIETFAYGELRAALNALPDTVPHTHA